MKETALQVLGQQYNQKFVEQLARKVDEKYWVKNTKAEYTTTRLLVSNFALHSALEKNKSPAAAIDFWVSAIGCSLDKIFVEFGKKCAKSEMENKPFELLMNSTDYIDIVFESVETKGDCLIFDVKLGIVCA